MSRPLRIEYPDACYHVMNRGRRSEKIYFDDTDRKAFIKVIQEAAELWNVRISAFCLMSNHYHLLIRTPDGNLSRCMRHINGVYTQRFNRRHEEDGPLFRGRYKAVLVAADSHLLEVLRYIHRSPVRAGIVMGLDDYPWSSHHGYLSRVKKWAWLDKDFLLSILAKRKINQKAAYIDFVTDNEPEEIEKFYSLKNLPSILGSDSFREFIREQFSDLGNQREIPESKVLALGADKVVTVVCDYYGISRDELSFSKRGARNTPRDIAIYLVRHLCRKTLPSVGQDFGIENYSTVSSVIQRVRSRGKTERKLRKEMAEIAKEVAKSQKRT